MLQSTVQVAYIGIYIMSSIPLTTAQANHFDSNAEQIFERQFVCLSFWCDIISNHFVGIISTSSELRTFYAWRGEILSLFFALLFRINRFFWLLYDLLGNYEICKCFGIRYVNFLSYSHRTSLCMRSKGHFFSFFFSSIT